MPVMTPFSADPTGGLPPAPIDSMEIQALAVIEDALRSTGVLPSDFPDAGPETAFDDYLRNLIDSVSLE